MTKFCTDLTSLDFRHGVRVLLALLWINLILHTQAQELEHFSEDHTVKFGRDYYLADMMPMETTGNKIQKTTTGGVHASAYSNSDMYGTTTINDDYRRPVTTTSRNSPRKKTTSYFDDGSNGSPTSKMMEMLYTSTASLKSDNYRSSTTDLQEEGPVKLGRVLDARKTTEFPRYRTDSGTKSTTMPETTMKTSGRTTTGFRLAGIVDVVEYTPPHITFPTSQEPVIVTNGLNETVCKADGYPKPTFQWYKDDKPISNNEYVKSFENGTLHIPGFIRRENGYYHCVAVNKYGTSVSVKVPFFAKQPPTGSNTDPETYVVDEGSSLGINCAKTPPTLPEYVKRWYTIKQTSEVTLDDRIGTDSEGTLRFAYVTPEDENQYRCGLAPLEAAASSFIVFYNEAKLEVKSNRLDDRAPKQEFISKNIKAVIGDSVTLECFYSGYPVPRLSWKNNSNHDIMRSNPRYSIQDYGRKLLIKTVRQEDEGTFTCVAENGVATKEDSITVNVTTPPLRIEGQGLTTLTKPDNQDVTLNCKARVAIGENLETPKWYRNGKPFNQDSLLDPSRYSFNADLTELTIRNLDVEQDTACFQCNTSNSEGYLWLDGYLRVIKSIEISQKPPSRVEVEHDDVIDISVLATGDPCCKIDYLWYFNDEVIERKHLLTAPFQMFQHNDTLLFNTSSVSNDTLQSWFGSYMCRVSNKYQSVMVEFVMSQAGSDSPVTAEPATASSSTIKLWWVGLICGLLAIAIAIGVFIFFLKSNFPRDTYMLEKTELKHDLNPKQDLLDQSFQEI